MESQSSLPDTERHWLIAALPASARPFGLLARFDRPIGWWLLFWPCAWSVALAGGAMERWNLLLWFLLGAIAMRGAGCVYNDIVDRELDRKVERTRTRPLASGRVSLRAAWIWLVLLCLIGLAVLLQVRWEAQLVALGSLALVAAYPFMKRITWWPQAWLGLVFSWGALVGWVAITGEYAPALFWLYAGSVFWVIGYDTIYALQDIEDDALAGVKSTARRFGKNARLGIALFYMAALICWCFAIWQIRPQWLGVSALLPAALHFIWQVATLHPGSGRDALAKFRSNREAGLLVALACLVVGASA
jgi:4-hydroxybenzoate polyprenyltransferase